MSRRARLRQFVFELIEGIHVAWALAVVHDCEYNGGHSWGPPSADPDMAGLGRTRICTHCGACETVPRLYVPDVPTFATGTHYTIRYADGQPQ